MDYNEQEEYDKAVESLNPWFITAYGLQKELDELEKRNAQNGKWARELFFENKQLKSEIAELKAEHEWISVEDQLPEKCDVVKTKSNMGIDVFSYEKDQWWFFNYGKIAWDKVPGYVHVQEWQPIPRENDNN